MPDQALTEAQREVATIVLDVLDGEGFCLAGGAALVASGLTERPTRDLDVFTDRDVDIRAAGDKVMGALQDAGFGVRVKRNQRQFVKLAVSAGRRGRVEVDLGRDHREWPATTTSLGRTLSSRELVTNKLLALFGRVQPRDLVDIATLATKVDLREVLIDAKDKDPGFHPKYLAEMIRMVIARPDNEWPPGCDVGEVRHFGDEFASSLEARSAGQ